MIDKQRLKYKKNKIKQNHNGFWNIKLRSLNMFESLIYVINYDSSFFSVNRNKERKKNTK